MTERDDHELLTEYACTRSEAAFATLVERYLNLVHSAAWRFTGNTHHAEEITQAVFVILARKAGGLRRGTVLSGWLYQTARLTAANFVKGEIRRQRREQEAYMQSTLTESEPAAWEKIAPLLDEAMGRLGETDRNAIVLRFFENKTAQEIAAKLKLSETAAHKRVSRALEKLYRYFSKRGVSSTTAIIAGAISAHSVQAAPAALAKSVTVVAVTKGAAAGGSTLTLIKGALKIMAWAKAKTTIVVGMGVLLAAGTITITVKEIHAYHRYAWQAPKASRDLIRQTPPQVVIVPTIFARDGGNYRDYSKGGGAMGICQPVTNIVQVAYDSDRYRMIFSPGLPDGRYDFFAKDVRSPQPYFQLDLREELKTKLGVIGKLEMREADVLLLRCRNPNAGGLKPPDSLRRSLNLPKNMRGMAGTNSIANFLSPISSLKDWLQVMLEVPVIDQTGLKGLYDFKLTWENSDQTQFSENIKQSLLDQLGLELVPSRETIEMLMVEKVR